MLITVSTTINAPLALVWSAWHTPSDIESWNFANDDWCCPLARSDFRVGGEFSYQMAAKDGSMSFDFNGQFTEVVPMQRIAYVIADGRKVSIDFVETASGVTITEQFEAEQTHPAELQQQGWQSILDNFKSYVLSL
ncbi:SRPBCC family protein [Pseudoalteromonas fenneropenaei]|uniref:SRPBCC family protein n=1 Tax=Pseudoalteromonas fenneropenaei TaxID=1737459 RepID=A0ABV7CPZ7_9GAMM